MVDVLCPKCDNSTDRVYTPPYGSKETGWMCADCIMELCDCAHLWAWSDADFKNNGLVKVAA